MSDSETGLFDTKISDGVLQVSRPGTQWLSTGPSGGTVDADAAYNVSVPEGWERTDLEAYVSERLEEAGFEAAGPALLTGVDLTHARVAAAEPVAVVATAGLSNPATLCPGSGESHAPTVHEGSDPPGTVNVIACVDRRLPEAAQANLVAVVAEAKAAVLLAEAGFPGTTTDAVVVGSAPDRPATRFTGSGTEVGAGVRACVREAVRGSLRSRYADEPLPATTAEADHGVVTDLDPEVHEP